MKRSPSARRQLDRALNFALEGLESRTLLSGGSLDPSFDGDGKRTDAVSAQADSANAVVQRQSDGKLIVAGTSGNSGFVARYNLDGSLDTTFGLSSGRTFVNLGDANKPDGLNAMKLDTGNSLLVAGFSDGNFLVGRLDQDGKPMASFGTNGWKTIDFGESAEQATSLDTGFSSIVVAGSVGVAGASDFAVVKLSPTGQPDSFFGSGGKLRVDFGGDDHARAIVNRMVAGTTPDQIYVAGERAVADPSATGGVRHDALIAGFSGEGGALSGFGQNGLVVYNPHGAAEFNTIQLRTSGGSPDGFDVGGGEGPDINHRQFVVAHFTLSGTLDGQLTREFLGADGKRRDAVITNMTQYFAVGRVATTNAKRSDYAVMRLRTVGGTDPEFGGSAGVVIVPNIGNPHAVIQQADGRVLVAGDINAQDAFLARFNGGDSTIAGHITMRTNGAPAANVHVYIDTNQNHQFDPGEISTRTDANGLYTLRDLGNGSHYVRVDAPAGLRAEHGPATPRELNDYAQASVFNGVNHLTGLDFSLTDTVRIQGSVLANHGQLFDGLVFVDRDRDGKLDANEPRAIDDQFTFELPAGNYQLRHLLLPGWTAASPNPINLNLPAGATAGGLFFLDNSPTWVSSDGTLTLRGSDFFGDTITIDTGTVNFDDYAFAQFTPNLKKIVVYGNGGNDRLVVKSGVKIPVLFEGGDGNDTATGGSANDTLRGGDGNDLLNGGEGNDQLDGGTGADKMNGDGGIDVVRYATRTKSIIASLDGVANDGEVGEKDLIGTTVEQIRGGQGDDTLTGNDLANTLYGDAGNDKLFGLGARDVLFGEAGNDTLDGGSGTDDLFKGGDGNDVLFARDGVRDSLDGEAGNDSAQIDSNLDVILNNSVETFLA